MRIFKNRAFSKWAAKEGLDDSALNAAIVEIEQGLVEADLGGHIIKKRVAVGGRGKSGGARTILAYQVGDKAFFIYGFAKNVQANISTKEIKALKLYARVLLAYTDKEISKAIEYGALVEVTNNG